MTDNYHYIIFFDSKYQTRIDDFLLEHYEWNERIDDHSREIGSLYKVEIIFHNEDSKNLFFLVFSEIIKEKWLL